MSFLFVYGTLLPGHAPAAMRDIVASLRPVGPATVRGSLYHLGAYPGLVLDAGDAGGGVVHGMVLEIPAENAAVSWLRLDAYEGCRPDAPERSLFRRVRARVKLDRGGDVFDAWVYVYNRQPPADSMIAAGVWRADAAAAGPGATTQGRTMTQPTTRRPIIGITLDYRNDQPTRYEGSADYAASVERAGGLPVFLPFRTDLSLIPEIVDALDGVLFSGGDDLDPAMYGQTYHPKAVPVDPARQRFELALLAEVERRRVPALGICMGSQLMNVHRGGSLHQFLPDEDRPDALEHRKMADDTRRHAVRIEPGTVLGEAIGKPEITANSRHKQSINALGRGLRVNAVAPDGVIEGVEDPTLPLFLAVQWHPENLSTSPEHLAPFRLLVEKAARAEK